MQTCTHYSDFRYLTTKIVPTPTTRDSICKHVDLAEANLAKAKLSLVFFRWVLSRETWRSNGTPLYKHQSLALNIPEASMTESSR